MKNLTFRCSVTQFSHWAASSGAAAFAATYRHGSRGGGAAGPCRNLYRLCHRQPARKGGCRVGFQNGTIPPAFRRRDFIHFHGNGIVFPIQEALNKFRIYSGFCFPGSTDSKRGTPKGAPKKLWEIPAIPYYGSSRKRRSWRSCRRRRTFPAFYPAS